MEIGPTRDAASSPSRALVVVTEHVAGEALRKALIEHLGSGISEVFVVSPAIVHSGFKHTMGDIDDGIEPARERLRETLQELRSAGLNADGEVGDSDPVQAISDEILKFGPERIVVVAHRESESDFAEKGLLEQAERDFDLPVTELVVNRAEEPDVLDVKRTTPVAGRKEGWRPSRNWPPLTRGDLGGILVAVLGTLVLGFLAAECVGDATGPDLEEGRLGAACAATILIALAMALVNLAHVVGLFLFQSVGYEGVFSRLFSRLSLVGTPTAIAAVLVLQLVK